MSPTADPGFRPRPGTEIPAIPRRTARPKDGFTLVEMLVAMAIFLLLLGSITLLLTGTVRTTRQGYAMLDGMERARGALNVLEQDLKAAFSNPDKAAAAQFYGEPNGFMYVGALKSGAFGRVVYTLRRDTDADPDGIVTTISVRWSAAAELLRRMVMNGEPGNDKNGDGKSDISFPGVDPDKGSNEETYEYAARIFSGFYPPPAVGGAEGFVVFPVRIVPGVLLRYEETGGGGDIMTLPPLSAEAVSQSSLESGLLRTAHGETLLRALDNRLFMHGISGGLPLSGYLPPPYVQRTVLDDLWAATPQDGGLGKNWREYVVVDRVILEARLMDENGADIIGYDSVLGAPIALNVLDLSAFFFYGTEDGTSLPVFNTLFNIAAFRDFTANPVDTDGFIRRVDLSGPGYVAGDPVQGRLPAWVAPGFWIYADPPNPDAPPFCQWFQQKVDLPMAFRRGGV